VLAGDLPEYLSPRLTGFTLDAFALGQRLAQALLAQFPDFSGVYRDAARMQSLWPLILRERDSDPAPAPSSSPSPSRDDR